MNPSLLQLLSFCNLSEDKRQEVAICLPDRKEVVGHTHWHWRRTFRKANIQRGVVITRDPPDFGTAINSVLKKLQSP
ncbi:hypothetical protein GJAV_G00147260 [Gymnothorax javanicus]|nr:hypothetical protein GJAV_G00147260 [Gymnothorax javanicus]